MFLVLAEALLPEGQPNSQYAPSSVVIRKFKGGTAYSELVAPWTEKSQTFIRGAISARERNAETLRSNRDPAFTAQWDRAGANRAIYDSVVQAHAPENMSHDQLRQSTHNVLNKKFHQDQMKDPQDMSFDDFKEIYNRRTHRGDQMQQTSMIVALSHLFVSEDMKEEQLGLSQDEEEPKETLQRELRQQKWKQQRDQWDEDAIEAGRVERRVREPTDRFPEHT
jgi:hypothetical protein